MSALIDLGKYLRRGRESLVRKEKVEVAARGGNSQTSGGNDAAVWDRAQTPRSSTVTRRESRSILQS